MLECYSFDAHTEKSYDDNERKSLFSSELSAVICTRAVLLQVIPQLSVLTAYVIGTAGCPLVLVKDSRIEQMLPP